MKETDEIILKAFLIALEQLDEPLPEAVQTELKEIAENIDLNLGKLDAISENNPKLNELYQEVRKAIQNEYATRSKSSAIAIEKNVENLALSQNLAYENQKILSMNSIQLSQMFKDFFIKRHSENHHSLLALLTTLQDITDDFPDIDEGLLPVDNIKF
jgi:hypothetical protein